TLIKDPTRPKHVVSDFAVSHVLVARKPHSCSMGFELHRKRVGLEKLQIGGPCEPNSIALVSRTASDPIHHDHDYRPGNPAEGWMPLQFPVGHDRAGHTTLGETMRSGGSGAECVFTNRAQAAASGMEVVDELFSVRANPGEGHLMLLTLLSGCGASRPP